jgi:sugar/nucleoside kinase (ribokinase family)
MAGPSIGAGSRPTVLVVGAASRDIDPSDPRGWRLGGGVTYASMAVARLGLAVRALMGADAETASAPELGLLRAAGVELQLVALDRGPIFDNIERPGGRVQICHQPSDKLPIEALPAEWRAPSAAILNPVAGELGDEWAAASDRSALVALGWQGLFRRLTAGERVTPLPLVRQPLLERADICVVSADDARAGGAPLDRLLRPGQQLVITDGTHGALHLDRLAAGWRQRRLPSRRVAQVGDPTGAGDVFLATWAACLAVLRDRGEQADAWRSLAVATAAAAAKVEARTLDAMPGLRVLCDRLLRPPGAVPPIG